MKRLLFWSLCLLFIGGVAVRLTIRDRWVPASVLFYGLPPLLLFLLGMTAAAGLWRQRQRRFAVAFFAMGIFCFGEAYRTAYFHHSATVSGKSHRVLLWNVCRGRLGFDAIATQIRHIDADVVGLVEADSDSEEMREFWNREFPGYQSLVLPNGLCLLTKGTVNQTEQGNLGPNGRYTLIRLTNRGDQLTLLLVDLDSNPFLSRQEPLERLTHFVESLPDRAIVVMGDFNTPPDSLFFDPLRRHFDNAFEAAGNGFYGTWPVPVPLLAIDHIWIGNGLETARCELCWTWRSDHRPVVAEVVFAKNR